MLVAQKTIPTVAIVILNYNGQQYLEQFLPSVLAYAYANQKVIVADNGSTDTSISFLEARYPNEVEIIDLKQNYGFAEGYNQALNQVSADYYILLNSDVEVRPNWITPIIDLMEQDTSIAACQPKVLAHHNKTIFEHAGAAGGYMDALGYPFCRGRIMDVCEEDTGQYDSIENIFWATGAALVIRAPLYHAIGQLDGDYFAHMEEIDLCWRLKRAGYKIMVVPESVVHHVGGGTLNYQSPRKTYLNFRNNISTLFKNEPSLKLLWLLPIRFSLDGIAGIVFILKGQYQHTLEIIKAHVYFYKNIRKLSAKRKSYSKLIEANKIGVETKEGRIAKSILWQYYALGKKAYKNIFGL